MDKHVCNHCGSGKNFLRRKGMNQIGLYCSDCTRWLKWVGKKSIPVFLRNGYKVHPEEYEPNAVGNQQVANQQGNMQQGFPQQGFTQQGLPTNLGGVEQGYYQTQQPQMPPNGFNAPQNMNYQEEQAFTPHQPNQNHMYNMDVPMGVHSDSVIENNKGFNNPLKANGHIGRKGRESVAPMPKGLASKRVVNSDSLMKERFEQQGVYLEPETNTYSTEGYEVNRKTGVTESTMVNNYTNDFMDTSFTQQMNEQETTHNHQEESCEDEYCVLCDGGSISSLENMYRTLTLFQSEDATYLKLKEGTKTTGRFSIKYCPSCGKNLSEKMKQEKSNKEHELASNY